MTRSRPAEDTREASREASLRWLQQRAVEATHRFEDASIRWAERTPPPGTVIDGRRAASNADRRGAVRHHRGAGRIGHEDSLTPGGSGGSIPWYVSDDAAFDYDQARGYDPRWLMDTRGALHSNPWHATPIDEVLPRLTERELHLADPHLDELEDWDLGPVRRPVRLPETYWQDPDDLFTFVLNEEALHALAEIDAMREAVREHEELRRKLKAATSPRHYVAIQEELSELRSKPYTPIDWNDPEAASVERARVARIQGRSHERRAERWRREQVDRINRDVIDEMVRESHRAVARGPGKKAAKEARRGLRYALERWVGRYTPPPPRPAVPYRFRRPPRPLCVTKPTPEYEHAMAVLWPDDKLASVTPIQRRRAK